MEIPFHFVEMLGLNLFAFTACYCDFLSTVFFNVFIFFFFASIVYKYTEEKDVKTPRRQYFSYLDIFFYEVFFVFCYFGVFFFVTYPVL